MPTSRFNGRFLYDPLSFTALFPFPSLELHHLRLIMNVLHTVQSGICLFPQRHAVSRTGQSGFLLHFIFLTVPDIHALNGYESFTPTQEFP